jgi:hypothetical protein
VRSGSGERGSVRGLAPLLVLSLFACGPAEPPPRASGSPDKRELFGDAGLVPTREGERMRRELAMADELERLLARASVPASVSVSLTEPASAVVVAGTGELEQVRTIARAALPGIADARIHVTIAELGEPEDHDDAPRLLPALVLTLGLGIALGVAMERGWQRLG